MPKKKVDEGETQQEEQPQFIKQEPCKKMYRVSSWRGVKDVYSCVQCGAFRDTKDMIIEHIILHYPLAMQSDILEKLLKEQ